MRPRTRSRRGDPFHALHIHRRRTHRLETKLCRHHGDELCAQLHPRPRASPAAARDAHHRRSAHARCRARPGAPYLERWALSVLSHAASVTPETVDSSRRVVLQHVDPGFYGKLEEALIVEADRIKKDHSSTIFYPDRARVNTSDLSVEVEGVQKTLVGSTVTSSRKKTWRLTFRYDAGRLFLTSLTDQPSSGS